MASVDTLKVLLRSAGDIDTCKVMASFATVTGALLTVLLTLKVSYRAYGGFRLYVWSQCCKTNLREKYGEWVVISGATDGIGLGLAKELARRGHSIVVIGRNEVKLEKTKLSIEQEPNVGKVITIKIDLSDSSMENFERIRNQIDPDTRDIGILINNAGTSNSAAVRYYNMDMDDIRSAVNVNILATLHLTRMILPGMVTRGRGLVVNVSSILGGFPAPFSGVYGLTKNFINSFSQQLQIEYCSYPIDIVNLTPGFVHTKLMTKFFYSDEPSLDSPSADKYANSALNAISVNYPSITGYWIHGITNFSLKLLHSIGLFNSIYLLYLRLSVKRVNLSLSQKRKGRVSGRQD